LFYHPVQSASTNFSGYYSASKGYNASTGVTPNKCSSSEDQSRSSHSQSESSDNSANIDDEILFIASETAARDNSNSMSLDPTLRSNNNIRRALLPHRSRSTRTKAVFVVGPPGYLAVLLNQQHLTAI
jgi:hypothetical protein